jgi:hypothetical protein
MTRPWRKKKLGERPGQEDACKVLQFPDMTRPWRKKKLGEGLVQEE